MTDLRFLSIDFLNTFLLTYRVFAEGVQVLLSISAVMFYELPIFDIEFNIYPKCLEVLEALKTVFFNPEPALSPSSSCG